MSAGNESAEVIVLVDDDTPLRQQMSKVLSRHGYRVLEAANGREALQLMAATSSPIKAIVTDVVMPWLGGREFINEVRTSGRQIAIVCASGFAGESDELKNVDADVLLTKPFSPRQLLRSIEDAVASREAKRADVTPH